MSSDVVREVLEKEFLKLKVTFTAKGRRREDGKTAADIEAEIAAQQEEGHGAQ